VPITIKECLDLVGSPSTFGLPSRRDTRASADDPYVARLRRAGAIVAGQDQRRAGSCFPRDRQSALRRSQHRSTPARTDVGSSGGQAAVIASGGSSSAWAPTWAGSIRVPAASAAWSA